MKNTLKLSALALFASLLTCSLMAVPIIVRINDIANGPPEVEVDGAPNGYDVCTPILSHVKEKSIHR